MLGVIPGKACAICRSSRYFTSSLCTGESYLKFGLNMQLKSIVVQCSSIDKVVGVWYLFIHFFSNLQVPGMKGRLITMIFFKCKRKGHIEFNVFQALSKKLEVLYDPKVNDEDLLMAKAGDAVLNKEVVRKIEKIQSSLIPIQR